MLKRALERDSADARARRGCDRKYYTADGMSMHFPSILSKRGKRKGGGAEVHERRTRRHVNRYAWRLVDDWKDIKIRETRELRNLCLRHSNARKIPIILDTTKLTHITKRPVLWFSDCLIIPPSRWNRCYRNLEIVFLCSRLKKAAFNCGTEKFDLRCLQVTENTFGKGNVPSRFPVKFQCNFRMKFHLERRHDNSYYRC